MSEKKTSGSIADSIKDGWRRTKQTTKVKLGRADQTVDDDEYEQYIVTCKDQHSLFKRVYTATVAHVSATKHMASSGLQLSTELVELYSDTNAEHRPLARAHQQMWTDVGTLTSRLMDTAMEERVLGPIQAQLDEYDRLFRLLDERRKRRQDYDYYRSKTHTLEKAKRDPKTEERIARNEEKLSQSKKIFDALTDETRQRMRELINERYDFFGGPFTQLVAAERAFHAGLARGFTPLEPWTSDTAIHTAIRAMKERPSRTRESTALAQLGMLTSRPSTEGAGMRDRASSFASSGDEGKGAENPFAVPPAEPQVPVVSMDSFEPAKRAPQAQPASEAQVHAQQPKAHAAATSVAAEAYAPPSYAATASDPWASEPACMGTDAAASSAQPVQAASAQQATNQELISFGADQPAAGGAAAVAEVPTDRYKALCDYAPTDQRMLAIKKGEILVKEKEEDGWFYGTNESGQSGYFPPNYCKKVA